MIKNEKPGLLERAMIAVEPLTSGRDFRLERISYKPLEGELTINLGSPDLDIAFRTILRGHSGVACHIRVNSEMKVFYTGYLFPVMGISVPIRNDETLPDYLNLKTTNPPATYQDESDHLFLTSGAPDEIYRQCVSMRDEILKIRTIFRREKIGETIQMYIIELKRNNRSEKYLDPDIFLGLFPSCNKMGEEA